MVIHDLAGRLFPLMFLYFCYFFNKTVINCWFDWLLYIIIHGGGSDQILLFAINFKRPVYSKNAP